jgi:hypothetical protein
VLEGRPPRCAAVPPSSAAAVQSADEEGCAGPSRSRVTGVRSRRCSDFSAGPLQVRPLPTFPRSPQSSRESSSMHARPGKTRAAVLARTVRPRALLHPFRPQSEPPQGGDDSTQARAYRVQRGGRGGPRRHSATSPVHPLSRPRCRAGPPPRRAASRHCHECVPPAVAPWLARMARACHAAAPAAKCVPEAALGGVDLALGGDGLGVTVVGAPGDASRDGRGGCRGRGPIPGRRGGRWCIVLTAEKASAACTALKLGWHRNGTIGNNG